MVCGGGGGGGGGGTHHHAALCLSCETQVSFVSCVFVVVFFLFCLWFLFVSF